MNREDIIRMAREAGMAGMLTDVVTTFDELERFAALVAAAEREECAKVCSEINREYDGEEVSAAWIACAIRARRNKMNLYQARSVAQELREYEAKDCCSQRTKAADTIDALVAKVERLRKQATGKQTLQVGPLEMEEAYWRDNLLNGG